MGQNLRPLWSSEVVVFERTRELRLWIMLSHFKFMGGVPGVCGCVDGLWYVGERRLRLNRRVFFWWK